MSRALPIAVLCAALASCPRTSGPAPGTAAPIATPPPPIPPDFTAACEEVARAECEWEVRCSRVDPLDARLCVSRAACEGERMQRAAAAGQLAVDREAAARCAAQFAAAACNPDVYPSCADVFNGRQTDGQPCLVRGACVPEDFCFIGLSCPPTCQPRAGLGESCSPLLPCASELRCSGTAGGVGKCAPASAPRSCSGPADCDSWSLCSADGGQGTCVPNYVILDAGATCSRGPGDGLLQLCGYPEVCDEAPDASFGVCTRLPGRDQPCHGACEFPLRCLATDAGQLCRPPAGAGEPCFTFGLECYAFYGCVDGRCAHQRGPGDPCAVDDLNCGYLSQCDLDAGRCARQEVGGYCDTDSDCASGVCESYEDPSAGSYQPSFSGGRQCLPSCL